MFGYAEFEKVELTPEEMVKYAQAYVAVGSTLIGEGKRPSHEEVRDYTAAFLEFGKIPQSREELEKTLLDILDKNPEEFYKFVDTAFKIDYASYKLAGGVGDIEKTPEKFEIPLPPPEPVEKKGKWKAILAGATLLGGLGAVVYIVDNFFTKGQSPQHYEELDKVPQDGYVKTNFSNNSSSQEKIEFTEIEKYGLEKNIPLNVSRKIEANLDYNASKELIDELSKLTEKKYVDIDINNSYAKKIIDEYSKKVEAEALDKISDIIVKDGKFSEEERSFLRFLQNLDGETIRWYFLEKNFGNKTVDYFNYLTSLDNKTLTKYAAENVLFFEDGNLSDEEKAVLENPKDVNKLYRVKLKYTNEFKKIPELEKQIKELPDYKHLDLKTLEALEDIAFLAKRSEPYEKFEDRFDPEKITKPREVYEAFELMTKGGIPDQRDFSYSVPKYNTELQCLWWLAENNELKDYDTLAQAIAMSHGAYITVGTEEVKEAVKKDINEFLKLGREISIIHRAQGLDYNIEDYPLDALIFWADRTGSSAIFGAYSFYEPDKEKGKTKDYRKVRLPLYGYEWDTVSIEALKEMRDKFIQEFMTIFKNRPDKFAKFLDKHFSAYIGAPNWVYTYDPKNKTPSEPNIVIDGIETIPLNYGNVDWNWNHYKNTGKGFGVCVEKAELVSSILKAYGIPSLKVRAVNYSGDERAGHTDFLFLNDNIYKSPMPFDSTVSWSFYSVIVPPIDQNKYFENTCYISDNMGKYTIDRACANFWMDLENKTNRTPPKPLEREKIKKILYGVAERKI